MINVAEERIEVAPGIVLHVLIRRSASSGRPVFLLVHGLASNARLWDGVADDLARQGYGSVAVDQRGHGRSDKPDASYDTDAVVADLVSLIAQVGLARPVLVGQSWGANVVVEVAARNPGLARGIVAVDGGFIDLAASFPAWEDCRAALAPPRFAGTPRGHFEERIRGAHPDWPDTGIDGTLANVELRDDGTVAPWLTYERHLLVLRGLWEHRPADAFARITEPVLFIVAGNDVQWAQGKRVSVDGASAILKDMRVEWFDGADHDVHAQHPAAVAELLIRSVESGWMR